MSCFKHLSKNITTFSRFDGRNFKTEPSSNYQHKWAKALGVYRGQPFVTGHHSSTLGFKTEILDYSSKQWNVVADYPFSTGDRWLFQLIICIWIACIFSISYYATTSTEESVFIIGGWTADSQTGSRTSIIAEYKNDQWYNAGNIKQSRHAHGAITSDSLTMVIGGSSADDHPWVSKFQTDIMDDNLWFIKTFQITDRGLGIWNTWKPNHFPNIDKRPLSRNRSFPCWHWLL